MSTDTANNTPRQIEFSAPESQESGWAFLGFAWRRKWLIAFAIVVALALGYLHFLKQPAMYQSSAQMLIVKQRGSVPISGVTLQTSYDSSHETHMIEMVNNRAKPEVALDLSPRESTLSRTDTISLTLESE